MPDDYKSALEFSHILLNRKHPKVRSKNIIVGATRDDVNVNDAKSVSKFLRYNRDLVKSLYGNDAHCLQFIQNDNVHHEPHCHNIVINFVDNHAITTINHTYKGKTINASYLYYIRHKGAYLSKKYGFSGPTQMGQHSHDYYVNKSIDKNTKTNPIGAIKRAYYVAYDKATSKSDFRNIIKNNGVIVKFSRKYKGLEFHYNHHYYKGSDLGLSYKATIGKIHHNYYYSKHPSNTESVSDILHHVPIHHRKSRHHDFVITPNMLGVRRDKSTKQISFHPKSPKVVKSLNSVMANLKRLAYQCRSDPNAKIKEQIELEKTEFDAKSKKLLMIRAEDLADKEAVDLQNYQTNQQIKNDQFLTKQMIKRNNEIDR